MFRKLFFFNFKIPGKIPKINFSKFEKSSLKNSKFQGVFPQNFPRKNENFQIFSSFKMFPPKNLSKIIFFNFKISGKIPKINFSKFENLLLQNSKFKGVFPVKISQIKMEIFKLFLFLKFSHREMFRKLFFLISKFPAKFPKLIFPNLKI
jgi:hypothetical protein